MNQAAEFDCDLVIAGGGLVGLGLACAMAGTGISVTVIDALDPAEASGEAQSWGKFSIDSPSHATSALENANSGVERGPITGPFGMAQGKVPEPEGLQTALERLRERLQG